MKIGRYGIYMPQLEMLYIVDYYGRHQIVLILKCKWGPNKKKQVRFLKTTICNQVTKLLDPVYFGKFLITGDIICLIIWLWITCYHPLFPPVACNVVMWYYNTSCFTYADKLNYRQQVQLFGKKCQKFSKLLKFYVHLEWHE